MKLSSLGISFLFSLFGALVALSSPALAQNPASPAVPAVNEDAWNVWSNARSLYGSGKFDEAAQALRLNPKESANYYYNLGTISYRQGGFGLAHSYLEKANRLRPHDASIRHNLSLARDRLAEKLGGTEHLDPASGWLENFADQIPMEEVRGTLGMIGLILVILWMRAYRNSRDILRTLTQPASVLTGIALAVTIALYWIERGAASHPAAMVIQAHVARSGPGNQYAEIRPIETGLKLRLTGPQAQSENAEQWSQVRLSSESIGWVPTASLLLL